MKIFYENKTYHMTLAIVAHNEKDIVIGTDTLIHHYFEDRTEYSYEKKITPLNKRTAFFFTGKFDGYMLQFARTFISLRKGVSDINQLRDEFMYNEALPPLREGHDVQFCFVGYIDGKPSMKAVRFEYGKDPFPFRLDHIFLPTGFERPMLKAQALLKEREITSKMRAAELKTTVKDVLTQCIEEFKDDEDEKLGGQPDVCVLRNR